MGDRWNQLPPGTPGTQARMTPRAGPREQPVGRHRYPTPPPPFSHPRPSSPPLSFSHLSGLGARRPRAASSVQRPACAPRSRGHRLCGRWQWTLSGPPFYRLVPFPAHLPPRGGGAAGWDQVPQGGADSYCRADSAAVTAVTWHPGRSGRQPMAGRAAGCRPAAFLLRLAVWAERATRPDSWGGPSSLREP